MKYLIYILSFLLIGVIAKAQLPSNTFRSRIFTGNTETQWLILDSPAVNPVLDTFYARYPGTQIIRIQGGDTAFWFYGGNRRWFRGLQAPDTVSLSNRINLKLNISDTASMLLSYLRKIDTTNKWVQDVYVRNDSLFKFKNGTETFLDTLGNGSGGGAGTVTSVALSMPSAFTVTGSPITGAGTLAVSGAGTTLQYIRGNGTLATFDTAAIPNFYLKVRGLLSGTPPITYSTTTGAIGIQNATASGTKGAATFDNSYFTDNGSGTVSLADLVSAGACINCQLSIDQKGRITSYADGNQLAIHNASGAGDTLVVGNDTVKRLNFSYGLTSTPTASNITVKVDTSAIATQYDLTLVNNGLSRNGDTTQFGQTVSASGDPAALNTNREIPTNGFSVLFTGTGRVSIGTTSPNSTHNFTSVATGTDRARQATAASGVAVNAASTGASAAIVAQNTGTGTGLQASSVGASGFGITTSSSIDGAIPFRASVFNTNNSSSSPTVAEFIRHANSGVPADGIGMTLMFRNQTSTTIEVESGQIRNYFSTVLHGLRSSAFEFHLVNSAISARKALLASSGQWTWDGYPALTQQTDTINIKPIGYNTTTGLVEPMANWVGSGVNSSIFTSDIPHLSQIKIYAPAQGVSASQSVTNYSATSLDSARYMFSTTRAGTAGSEYGGWLAPASSGDSILVTAPFWVVFGDSQAEGHPGLHGRLHPLVAGAAQNIFIYNYPDSIGQLSYHLRTRTNMRWYNQGIGGQTTVQCRIRFARDVLGVLSANSNDGRGNQTLSRKPQGVVIIVGINDIFNGVPTQTTKDNLEWMASQCQQNDIRCVILNMPGDAVSSQAQLQGIASMNEWLNSGVMDQYGASLVDYNSWWNDPDFGYDNIHPTALIVDDIHPSAVGYDSLAAYIYRQALLPVLRQAVFINELSPTTPITYARPSSITINSSPYSLISLNDTINITTFVPDSVWIKITASTPVTGTDSTGFSHIEWFSDNNPLDSLFYTRKTLYSGSQKANINASKILLQSETLVNGDDIFRTYLGDATNIGFTMRHYAATARMIINGNTEYNSAALSIGGATNAIGTTGNIKSTGTASQFGVLEILQNASAGTTGFGISTANTASSLSLQGTASQGNDLIRVTTWNGGVSNLATSKVNLLNITGAGFGISTGADQTGNGLLVNPTINHNTSANSGIWINGVVYEPIITTLGNARHRGFFNTYGNNYFNALGDSTCFGCDSNATIGAKFRVNGNFRIDNITPPPSTYNILVHGSTDSIVYQIPSSTFATTTLYTVDGTLSGNRIVTANNLNLIFNDVNTYRINSDLNIFAKADGTIPYSSVISGSGNIWELGYTPTAGTFSKGAGIFIDTNNNIGLAIQMPTSVPLYTTGNSAYVQGFQSNAGNFYRVDNVTTNITAALTQYWFDIDATSGNITITLPAASTAFGSGMGIQYVFRRMDATGNTITVSRAGSDTINAATTFTLGTQYEVKELQCTSTSTWGIK